MAYKRAAIRQAQRAAKRDLQRAGVAVVTVYHDDWCGHWRGQACNCKAMVGPVRRDPLLAGADRCIGRRER